VIRQPQSLVANPLFPSSLSAVLAWHLRRYPLMRAQDIYKLVHQGVFGPGHIISSANSARRILDDELAALQVRSQSEPEFEPIEPDGRLVRVNLRPFAVAAEVRSQKAECRRQNGGAEWLVAAMVESARRVKGDPGQMTRRLATAVKWCHRNLPRQSAELERMAARAEESGFPAFHHSPAYSRAYRPAYRVILRAYLNPKT
jgi:hypothetical protein